MAGEITIREDVPAKPEPGLLIPCFAVMYGRLSLIAREYGYALTVHGSMQRDLDLVAVPWVEDASEPVDLVEAIRGAVGGFLSPSDPGPTVKPHGRLGWAIHLGGGPYIDLSVCPRQIGGAT